jgi:hypothetical protein
MDPFERAEAKRHLLAREIIPVWAEFRSEVQSLTDSYNRTSKGRIYPAKLKVLHDARALVVTSITGPAGDQYNFITIEIRAAVREERFQIEATKKEWEAPQGGLPAERADSTEYMFQLDGDVTTGATWLAYQERKLSGSESAELLLFDALTGTAPDSGQ